MDVAPVIEKLKADVPALESRVEGALELAELVKQNALPQRTPAAYVLPLGLRGRPANSAAGLYRQNFNEVIGVMLFVSAHGDPQGERALTVLDTLTRDVIATIAGWTPSTEALGVFELLRADLVSMNDGVAIYQIDFGIESQLRLARSE